jgi:hypothetical protein
MVVRPAFVIRPLGSVPGTVAGIVSDKGSGSAAQAD